MSIDITLAAESVQDPYAEQFKVIYRAAAGFSNPGGLAVIWWA